MAPTYHDLKLMTVAQLRDMAKGLQHEAVQGYSQMNKDHLLPAHLQGARHRYDGPPHGPRASTSRPSSSPDAG